MVGKRSVRALTAGSKLAAPTGGACPIGVATLESMILPFAHVAGVLAPLELLPLLLAAGLYAKRAATLAARGRPLPLWRQLCFSAGLLTIVVALLSPLGHISEE